MQIVINSFVTTPIYEQIAEQIERQIVSGVLKSGEVLPSIRVLANELKVSVITTKKAYEVLEQRGWVIMAPQRGTLVGPMDIGTMKEKIREEIKQRFLALEEFAYGHGFSGEEFRDLIHEEEKKC